MTQGAETFIAVDIGGTRCAVSLAEGAARFVERRELSTGEELFRTPALKELAKEALPGAVEVCEVVPAQLRDHVGDYAALAAATYGMEAV